MDVYVVAVEPYEMQLAPVGFHERADDVPADSFDLFLRTLVHDGCACMTFGVVGRRMVKKTGRWIILHRERLAPSFGGSTVADRMVTKWRATV
jgi:hypothetical protein